MNIANYQLEDLLLFSPDVYFSSIAFYNQSIWPLPLLAILLSLVFFWLTLTLNHNKSLLAGLILTLGWAWCGAVYHLKFYQQINWMAFYYGWFFIAQSGVMILLLVRYFYQADQLMPSSTWQTGLGKTLIGSSVFILPFIGLIDGASIKASLILCLSLAPTLLATFGFALMIKKIPGWLLMLPFTYTLVGLLTSHTIGSAQFFAYFLCLMAALTLIGKWLYKKVVKT